MLTDRMSTVKDQLTHSQDQIDAYIQDIGDFSSVVDEREYLEGESGEELKDD